MYKSSSDLLNDDSVIVPVPSHPLSLLQRRYNQSALLAVGLGRKMNARVGVDALTRIRRTKKQKNMSFTERFENQMNSIVPSKKAKTLLNHQTVLLIDDVLTSGATLAAATEACIAAGAQNVNILTLARASKDA